jgi:nitroreductase
METLEAIKKRASLKTHLSTRDVELEKIIEILEAARLAPSATNEQPWRFVVVRGKENVENVVTRASRMGKKAFDQAPVLILVFVNPKDYVFPDGKTFYLIDIGLAMENFLLAATDLGLITHPMASLDGGKLKEMLGVPDEMEFVIATPLGYPVEGSYEEAAQERLSQRTRKELKELVYKNAWGKPYLIK